MSARTDLVPIDAEEFLSGIQAQLEGRNGAAPSRAGAVQFFHPASLGGLREFAPEAASPFVSRLMRLGSELQVRAAQIGDAPVSPGTFRGAIGERIIGVLRHLLWWYTRSVSAFADAATRAHKEQLSLLQQLSDAQEEAARQHRQLASRISQLEADIRSAAESRAALAAEFRAAQALREKADPRLAALYPSFEDVFRGPREEVRQRLTVYLPLLRQVQADAPQAPVLDLGCGRGEWLELLRDNQIPAHGRDLNAAMVQRCHALGLDAAQGDALEHLRSLPDSHLGAITCFHMIEHIPFASLLTLLEESRRVLRPGGLLILETPNPRNLAVASHSFYLDPTHLRPLPPEMLRFFVEAAGFSNAEVMELHPGPVSPDDEDPNLSGRWKDLLCGPRDYGLTARRP